MVTIDAQVHAYERDHPGRPWAGTLPGAPQATGEQIVGMMNELGIDGTIIVSPFVQYRYDASYALEVYVRHPTRFRLVKPVDPSDPAVADTIADWAATDGAVGVRLMLMNRETPEDPADPGLNRVLAAAARHSLPVNLACRGRLSQVRGLAERNPGTTLVVDHLGLRQVYKPPPLPEPFAELPSLLALGELPNLRVKISGVCTLSATAFPFEDIWEPLERVFEAFGMDRCMWGTDWTRATALRTFRDAVEAFRVTDRLSESDKAALMGGTLQEVYGWRR